MTASQRIAKAEEERRKAQEASKEEARKAMAAHAEETSQRLAQIEEERLKAEEAREAEKNRVADEEARAQQEAMEREQEDKRRREQEEEKRIAKEAEEKRRKQEVEAAKRKEEEEEKETARLKAEKQAAEEKREKEEAARIKAEKEEEDRRRKEEEEEKKKIEAEERRRLEAEAKKRKEEEEQEAARIKAEKEAAAEKRKNEEAARIRAEKEEAERKEREEEEKRKAKEAEEKRKKDETEEEEKRKQQEAARLRVQKEEEEAQKREEERKRRVALEEEERKRKVAEERQRKEEERKRQAEELRQRREAEEAEKRRLEAEEARLQEEKEQKRKAEEEERRKKSAAEREEKKKKAAEDRRLKEEEEARRKAEQLEEETRRKESETKRKAEADEEEARRKESEAKRKAEAASKRAAEAEAKRAAETEERERRKDAETSKTQGADEADPDEADPDDGTKKPIRTPPSGSLSSLTRMGSFAPGGRLGGQLGGKPGGSLTGNSRYAPQPGGETFNVCDMLGWKAVAESEELRDENVLYSTAAAEGAGIGANRGADIQRRDSAPAGAAEAEAGGKDGGGWREDAARAQKARVDKAERTVNRGDDPRRRERDPRRRDREDGHRDRREKSPPPPKLEASATSWVAQQKAQKTDGGEDGTPSDMAVVRSMKSILNKLTVEKFSSLYQQLIGCGIHKTEHIEILMREVFEKATTQHHFIPMYTTLCVQLHEWFVEVGIGADDKGGGNFKRILLNECQLSFEQNLKPLDNLTNLSDEERKEAELLHKTRMLGNIRFVGTLLEKKMLASRILVAVVHELLADPTPASLECLAVFLNVVGPAFDRSDWAHHGALRSAFDSVKMQTKRKDIPSRIKCLLQDVLDYRANGWVDIRKATKRIEGPTTLDAVHKKAEEELGVPVNGKNIRPAENSGKSEPASGGGRERMGSTWKEPPRSGPTSPTPKSATSSSRPWARSDRSGSKVDPTANASPSSPAPSRSSRADAGDYSSPARKKSSEPFDLPRFHEELSGTLRELASSLDVGEAVQRLGSQAVPEDMQPQELADLLARVSEEAKGAARTAGFQMVVALTSGGGPWHPKSLQRGLDLYIAQYEDLLVDLPTLPSIVSTELAPALSEAVSSGVLPEASRDALLSRAG